MVDSETAVDILTEGHDASRVAESLIQRAPGVTDGDGVAFYYEGDLGDSDCGSTGDHEGDTWDDWCNSAFHNGYGGFPPDADDPQQPAMFSNQLFWDDDIAKPSRMWPDGKIAPGGGGGGHQAEVYTGSGGGFVPTTAGGCGSPGSGPSSGSGGSGGGEVVAASDGGNADSPACSGGGIRVCGIGNFTQIVPLGAVGTGTTAPTGILPA